MRIINWIDRLDLKIEAALAWTLVFRLVKSSRLGPAISRSLTGDSIIFMLDLDGGSAETRVLFAVSYLLDSSSGRIAQSRAAACSKFAAFNKTVVEKTGRSESGNRERFWPMFRIPPSSLRGIDFPCDLPGQPSEDNSLEKDPGTIDVEVVSFTDRF